MDFMKHYILILFWFNLLAWCDVGGMLKSQIDKTNYFIRVLGFLGLFASLVILLFFTYPKTDKNNPTFMILDSWHFGVLAFLTMTMILLLIKLFKSKLNSKKILNS